MVLGLRTLAHGVRGGARAVGGAAKAVAGVAVGGMIGAVLLVSLTQAPQLLLPGVLGAAAAARVLGANQKGRKGAEAESEGEVTGAMVGCPEGATKEELGSVVAECEGGSSEGCAVIETRRSSSETGSVQEKERSDCHVRSLLRSLSDGALDVSEEEWERSGMPLVQQQAVGAGEGEGEEQEKVYRNSDQGRPSVCPQHQPRGFCETCATFTGTGQELLAWAQGYESTLLEVWVLAILKQAALVLAALQARGVCLRSLRPANIVLTRFPFLGRPPTAEHVHLAGDLLEVPKTALPLATRAADVFALGLAASELLGNVSPFTEELVAAMLRAEPWARPTAAELGALLAQHPLLS